MAETGRKASKGYLDTERRDRQEDGRWNPRGVHDPYRGGVGLWEIGMTQQMIWGSLYDGFPVFLYTTENTVKSFIRQMSSLSLEITDFLLLGKLKIFPMRASASRLTVDRQR